MEDLKRSGECIWEEVVEGRSKLAIEILQDVNMHAGALTVILGLLLTYITFYMKFENKTSYRNLGVYTATVALHQAMYVVHPLSNLTIFNEFACLLVQWERFLLFVMYPIVLDIVDIQIFNFTGCQSFAFCEMFMSVLEIETLTHVCIERYVTAKYKVLGKPSQNYNLYYFFISLMFALMYTYPAALGYGGFSKDFTCTYCTYDMVLPTNWQRYFIAGVFFFKSIKPVGVMFMMLHWAYEKELALKYNKQQRSLTEGTTIMVLIMLLCWIPITFIRASVIVKQLLFGVIEVDLPMHSVLIAIFTHWMAPLMGFLGLLAFDCTLRGNLIALYYSIMYDQEYIVPAPPPPPPTRKVTKSE